MRPHYLTGLAVLHTKAGSCLNRIVFMNTGLNTEVEKVFRLEYSDYTNIQSMNTFAGPIHYS